MQDTTATPPFRFMTRVSLPELTGDTATNRAELLEGINAGDYGSIWYYF